MEYALDILLNANCTKMKYGICTTSSGPILWAHIFLQYPDTSNFQGLVAYLAHRICPLNSLKPFPQKLGCPQK